MYTVKGRTIGNRYNVSTFHATAAVYVNKNISRAITVTGLEQKEGTKEGGPLLGAHSVPPRVSSFTHIIHTSYYITAVQVRGIFPVLGFLSLLRTILVHAYI